MRARPFVVRCRRRPELAIWAWWVEVGDSAGIPVWDTIAGVVGKWQGPQVVSVPVARALIEMSWAGIREQLANDCALHNILFPDSMHACAALALKRETALAQAIERRQARLASRLVQRGLFDRRAEREAQSQRELLEQALLRCGERRGTLERLENLTVVVRPAFASVPW